MSAFASCSRNSPRAGCVTFRVARFPCARTISYSTPTASLVLLNTALLIGPFKVLLETLSVLVLALFILLLRSLRRAVLDGNCASPIRATGRRRVRQREGKK